MSTSVSGSRGCSWTLIQQRLAALHFYIPQTGVFDSGTGLALDAYHRLLHWGTYQTLDSRTISFLLDGYGAFPVRFPSHGKHAEGDLALQLLALVYGSHVVAIYPISSGKPSTPTILGDFHVYSKVPGYLPDGMYYSNFFIRRLRDPRLRPGARLSRQPRLHAPADRRRDLGLQLARRSATGSTRTTDTTRAAAESNDGRSSAPAEAAREPRQVAQPEPVHEQRDDRRQSVVDPGVARAHDRVEGRGQGLGSAVDEPARLRVRACSAPSASSPRCPADELGLLVHRGAGHLIAREHRERHDDEPAADE